MSQDEKPEKSDIIDPDAELTSRREFLIGLGKWSKVIVGSALLGGCYTYGGTGWINRRGGWINGRGYGGGGWVNRRHNYRGGGGWVNRRGGGRSWVNRR
jgi:hypothetical protein